MLPARRRLSLIAAAALASAPSCGDGACRGAEPADAGIAVSAEPAEPRALALGYGGSAETDLELGAVLGRDHTVSVHFLPQQTLGPAGPVVSAGAPEAYAAGLGDPRWGKGSATLFLEAGGRRVVYEPERIARGTGLGPGDERLADFEGTSYAGFQVEGRAFGAHPALAPLGESPIAGWGGEGYATSGGADDRETGTLSSTSFPIRKPYLRFLIGGGRQPGRVGVRLKIGRAVVRDSTGPNSDRLHLECWDLSDHLGQEAILEIYDTSKEAWGHVIADEIVASDRPILAPGMWQHLAVVRRGPRLALYLNGVHLGPDLDLTGLAASLPEASARLRIGAASGDRPERQLYGLVDDLAVYDRALSDPEIEAAGARTARLSGAEPGLIAGWRFDEGGAPPKTLARVLVPSPSGAALVLVGADRRASDAAAFPSSKGANPLALPFPPNQAWEVLHGWGDRRGDHLGTGAFAWDFVLAGKASDETLGKWIHAAAPGRIVEADDEQPERGERPNHVVVDLGQGELANYLHLVPGSLREAIPKREGPGAAITAGQRLCRAGDTGTGREGPILHFSISNHPDTPGHRADRVTIPTGFSDYQASDDEGRTWRRVPFGVPTTGQWVKR